MKRLIAKDHHGTTGVWENGHFYPFGYPFAEMLRLVRRYPTLAGFKSLRARRACGRPWPDGREVSL